MWGREMWGREMWGREMWGREMWEQLPTSTNAPIAVFGNTVLVPAGGPRTSAAGGGGNPQLVAYTAR